MIIIIITKIIPILILIIILIIIGTCSRTPIDIQANGYTLKSNVHFIHQRIHFESYPYRMQSPLDLGQLPLAR